MSSFFSESSWLRPTARVAEQGAHRDVIVVGGGFTGAALACALADGRRRIHVLEARREQPDRYAGELIHPTGVEELERLDLVAPLLAAGAVRVDGFSVHQGARPSVTLAFRDVPRGAPSGLAIDHHRLVETLREAAVRRPGVRLELGARVRELVRQDGRVVGVRLVDGTTHLADLVLAADGRHSKLRSDLGVDVQPTTVSMTAALRVPGGSLPRPGHGHIFLGAWGPILAYPISSTEVRMCFDLPRSVVVAGLPERLRAEYLPHVPEPLRAGAEAALRSEPLQIAANQAMVAPSCVAPGAALVGDVGGCAHPLTAAGMTICLRDIHYLVDELGIGGDLARYQSRRGQFVRSRALLTAALYHVMRGADPVARSLRDGLFDYWQSPRSRAASLALLTGAESSWLAFAREYGSVMLSAAIASARPG